MDENFTPDIVRQQMEDAWAVPDPSDAANLLRSVVLEAAAAWEADRENLADVSDALDAILDCWEDDRELLHRVGEALLALSHTDAEFTAEEHEALMDYRRRTGLVER